MNKNPEEDNATSLGGDDRDYFKKANYLMPCMVEQVRNMVKHVKKIFP